MLRNRKGKKIKSSLGLGNFTYSLSLAHKKVFAVAIAALLATALILALPYLRPAKETNKGILKELTGQRTENSLTYKNSNGTYTKRLYSKPANYKDAKGQWQKIDTSIATKGSKLEVTKTPYKLYFSSSSKDVLAFKVDDKSLEFSPKGISYSHAKVSGSKATYVDVYNKTDLERIATSTGLKQNYILKATGHPATFTETLNTSLKPKLVKDGSLRFYDGSKVVATAPRPYLTDANGVIKDADFKLSGNALTTTLPSLKGLKYPITVDPSIIKSYATSGDDTYVWFKNPGEYYSYPTSDMVRVRGSSGPYRAYLKFSLSGVLPDTVGQPIGSAKLWVAGYPGRSGDASGTDVYRSGAFNVSAPGSQLWNASYQTPALAQWPRQTVGSWYNADITDSLKTELGYGSSHAYYQLHGILGGYNDYASSDYTGTSYDPYIEVVYTLPAPSLGTLTASSASQISANITDGSLEEDDFHFYINTNSTPNNDDGLPVVSTTKATIGTTYNKLFTGLSPDTLYYVRSTSHEHATPIHSKFSNERSLYTLANAPLAPTVTNMGTSTDRLKLAINTNGNPSNTTYAIYDESESKYIQANGSLGTTAVFKTYGVWGGFDITSRGLKPNTSHSYQVKAKNGNGVETGFGPLSNSVVTGAAPPINLKARDFYDGSGNYNIKLTWDEAFPAYPASYYRVYSSTDDGQNWTQLGGNITQKEYTYQTNEDDYLFKVTSVGSNGLENPLYVSIKPGTREAKSGIDKGDGTDGDLVVDGKTAANSTDGIKHDINNPYVLDGVFNFNNVTIQNDAALTHSLNSGGLVLKVKEDFRLDASSIINLDGKGYPGGQGPGSGGSNYYGSGGGGYGSSGGSSDAGGGQPYGDEKAPAYMGSSGGNDLIQYAAPGGGRIQINAKKIVVEGEVAANGLGGDGSRGGYRGGSGGGSGGSIWLNGTYVYNNGLLSAAGGGGGAAPGNTWEGGQGGNDGKGGNGGGGTYKACSVCPYNYYSGGTGGIAGISGPGGSRRGRLTAGGNGGFSAGGSGASDAYSGGGGGGAGRIAIRYQVFNGTQVNNGEDGYVDSPRGGAAGPYAYYQSIADEQELDLPVAPMSLSALAMSFDKINLVWLNPGGTSVTGFKIFRNGLEVANTTSTSYTDINLDPGTDYRYQVKAYNANGDLSSFSNTAFATTFSFEYPKLDENTIYADENTLGTLDMINSGSSSQYVSVDMGTLNAGVEKTVSDLKYKRSYFKFPLESINKPVTSATLYLDYVGKSQVIPDTEEVKVDSIADYGLLSNDWSDGNLTDSPILTGTGAQGNVTISTTRNISEFIAGYDPDNNVVPNFNNLTITSTGRLITSSQVKLSFRVKGTLSIGTGGKINANGMGNISGPGIGGSFNPGDGLGGGGGGYGGGGGSGSRYAGMFYGYNGGPSYGEYPEEPTFGSGGGAEPTAPSVSGGGAIKIEADRVTNNGEITADGNGVSYNTRKHGGGSGGGIYIASPNLVNASKIFARGGPGGSAYVTQFECCGGGGGGGRVSIKAPVTGNPDVSGGLNGDAVQEGGDGANGVFVQLNPSGTVNAEEGAIDDWNTKVNDSSIEPSGWLNQSTLAGTKTIDVTNQLEKDLTKGLDFSSFRLRGLPERSDKNTYFSFVSLGSFRPRLVVKTIDSKPPTINSQADSSIQLTVSTLDNSKSEDDFHYSIGTDGFNFTDKLPVISETKRTSGTYYFKIFDNLLPNTQYFIRAYGHDHKNDIKSPYAQTSVYTLATRPLAPTVSKISKTAVNISVNSGLNSAGTKYAILNETTAEFVQSDGTLGATPVYRTKSDWGTTTNTGLQPETRYSYKVIAQNGDGIATLFGPQASAQTDADTTPPASIPLEEDEKLPTGNIVNYPGGVEDGYLRYYWIKSGINPINTGTDVNTGSGSIIVGHNNYWGGSGSTANYSRYRGYLTFDTSIIPDDAIMTGATLNFRVSSINKNSMDSDIMVYYGNQPSWGTLLAVGDWIDYPYSASAKLNTSLVSAGSSHSLKVPMSSINKTGRSEYNLIDSRESSSGNNSWDTMMMNIDSANSAGNKPYLAISYLASSPSLATPTLNTLTADIENKLTLNITNNASTADQIRFYKGLTTGPIADTNDPILLNANPTGTGVQGNVTVTGTHDIGEYIAGYSPVDGIIPNFDKLTIASGGVLTTPPRVKLEFKAKEVVVQSGGVIDATGKGYAGASISEYIGQGPGGGYRGGGGGYGGLGGKGSRGDSIPGGVYSAFPNPVTFGSGGSYGAGNGGGAIVMKTGSLTLNGQILANGGNGILQGFYDYGGSGGSGGGISITVTNGVAFDASNVSAKGGMASADGPGCGQCGSGGGGGGRIVINGLSSGTPFVSGGLGTVEVNPNNGLGGTGTINSSNYTVPSLTSKSFSELLTNTRYYIRSRAYDYTNSLVSGYSNELAAYTLAKKPARPILNQQSSSSIKVTLNGLNGNPSSTKFAIFNSTTSSYVQANGSLGAGAVYQTYSQWGGTNGVVNTGLQSGKNYTYKIKAQNGNGIDTAFSDEASVYTTVIGPKNLTATSNYSDSDGHYVDLSWEHGDPANPASYYYLYFSTNGGQNWSLLKNDITDTGYKHKTLKARTTYSYKVVAANANKEANEGSSITANATTTYPGAPTNLSGSAEDAVDIRLDWDVPTGAVTIDGYRIYRDNKEIADVKTTTYKDRVSPKTTYDYYIKAYDKFGYLSDPTSTIAVGSLGMPHGFFENNTDACAGCHRTHTAVDEGILKKIQKDLCYACHDGSGSNYNVKAEFGEDGDPKASAHPVPTLGMKCSDCHDPHGSKDENGDYYPRILRAKKPDGAYVYQGNEFCGACHGANSPIDSNKKASEDHIVNYTGTPHDTNLVEPPSGTKIKCVNCHSKHASDNNTLLNVIVNGFEVVNNNNGICFTCHKGGKYAYSGKDVFEQTKHAEIPNRSIVDTSDSGYVMGYCQNCHNPHGVTGTTDYRQKPKNELCKTCHDKKAPPTNKVAHEGTYNTPSKGGRPTIFSGVQVRLPIDTDISINLGRLATGLESEDRFIKGRLLLLLRSDIYGVNYFVDTVRPINIYVNNAPTSIGATFVGEYADPMVIVGTRRKQYDISDWLNNNKNEQVFIILKMPAGSYSNEVAPIDYLFDSTYQDNNPASNQDYYAYQGNNKYNQSAHGSTTDLRNIWPNTSETGSGIGTGGATAGECINCHNPHGKKDENGKPYPKMLQDKEEDFCFTCHDKKENSDKGKNIKESFTAADPYYNTDMTRSYKTWTRHGINDNEGMKLECTSCHNAHLNNAQNKVIDPDNKSTLYTQTMTDPVNGGSVPDINGFCMKCHDEKQNVNLISNSIGFNVVDIKYFENNHGNLDASGIYKNGKTRDELYGPMKAPYKRGMGPLPCTTCHDEHGSSNVFHIPEQVNGKAVSIKEGYFQTNYEPLCSACHETTSMNNAHGDINCGAQAGGCHNSSNAPWWGGLPAGRGCLNCHNHSGPGTGLPMYYLDTGMLDWRF